MTIIEEFINRAKTQKPVRLTPAERDELGRYAETRGPKVAARFRSHNKLGKYEFEVVTDAVSDAEIGGDGDPAGDDEPQAEATPQED